MTWEEDNWSIMGFSFVDLSEGRHHRFGSFNVYGITQVKATKSLLPHVCEDDCDAMKKTQPFLLDGTHPLTATFYRSSFFVC